MSANNVEEQPGTSSENKHELYEMSPRQQNNWKSKARGQSDGNEPRNDVGSAGVQWNTGDQEKQIALGKLRERQTNDDEEFEEFETFQNDSYDIEPYNKAKEKYVFFWSSNDIYSQWNTQRKFYVKGKQFNCAEQFMMYEQAVMFEDWEIAEDISWCKNPRKMKALGREVRGFDEKIWTQHCLYIVKEGNMEKFTQNEDFLADLLLTYPKLLVEASPLDKIWGIGLEEHQPEAWDESTWDGKNYLGYVLTEVRDDIMVARGMIDEKERERHIERLLYQAGYEPIPESDQNIPYYSPDHEEYLLFSKGMYHQWYHSFFEVGKIQFNSAEQYMMFSKAVLFQDRGIAQQILDCDNPKKIMALGRKVRGFDEKTWEQHCLQIVKQGNLAKFQQNERLRKAIITTYPKIFAEANPHDDLWGIGLGEDNPNARNKDKWRGWNCLGYILTEVRDEILFDSGLIKQGKVAKYIDRLHADWGTPVDGVFQHDKKDKNIARHEKYIPWLHVEKPAKSELSDANEPRYDVENTCMQVHTENQEKRIAPGKLRERQACSNEGENETFQNDSFANDAFIRARDKYIFFWKTEDIYSQLNTQRKFYVDGQQFNSAEQFMMYKKAVLFGDEKIAQDILWCKDPRKIKVFGREITGVDDKLWTKHCLFIAKKGNMEKFTQNEDFLAELLLTYPKILVEASPYDNKWGIGREEHEPEAWDESTWDGKNYLGYVLTEVRDDILVVRGMIHEKERGRHIERLLYQAGYEPIPESDQNIPYYSPDHEEYLLFSKGMYHQWYHSFFEVGKIQFNSAEQYMVYSKAVLFQDRSIAQQILKCDNPKQIKALGRKVRGFDEKTWEQHCLQIVKKGNLAKFQQNERLRKAIITTYPKIFAEANPNDDVWGIGLGEDNPNARNKDKWRGWNCLGYILTEVRDEILFDSGLIKKDKMAKYIDKLHADWGTPVDGVFQHDKDKNIARNEKYIPGLHAEKPTKNTKGSKTADIRKNAQKERYIPGLHVETPAKHKKDGKTTDNEKDDRKEKNIPGRHVERPTTNKSINKSGLIDENQRSVDFEHNAGKKFVKHGDQNATSNIRENDA